MNDVMFVPDDAHRQRVADAVRAAGDTGMVSLTLSADEADNLHILAVDRYRQLRDELDQPTRNVLLALLQVLDEATKAAFAKRNARSLLNWKFFEGASAVLADNLALHVDAVQGHQLLGAVSTVDLGLSDEQVVDGVVKRLDELRPATDLGHQAQQRAVAKRLLALYRETVIV